MAEQEHLRVVQETFDAWNAHDADRFVAVLAEDYVWESDTLPESLHGHEGARQALQMYVQAFPDLHLHVEQMLASGDYVVVRWWSNGTHRGELAGIPPTNRQVGVHGCTVDEIRNGKVVRSWIYWDTGRMMQQMGVLPGSSET